MKRKLVLWLTFLMLLVISVPVYAYADEHDERRLIDDAGLLSDSVKNELSKQLDDIVAEYRLEAVVLLLEDYETYDPSITAASPEEFVRAYYNQQGFGYDDENSGIILLISMEERDWHMYIQGEARVAVNNYGYEYISSRLVDEIGDGDFESGITHYVNNIQKFYEEYSTGKPYGSDHRLKEPGRVSLFFAVAIGISLILAFIVVHSMKSRMNTAKPQLAAREYVRQGSFAVTNQQDLYLYSHTTKTARPKETSSGSGGGGSSSGSRGGSGGGGKF